MFEVRLTEGNGKQDSQTFDDYDAMVAWIAAHPEAGIMAWEDGEGLDTARYMQLQQDVEALQS